MTETDRVTEVKQTMQLSDNEALERCARGLRTGDARAYAEFAATYAPVFRVRFLRCGLRPVDAEDLAESCVIDIALKVKSQQYTHVRDGGFAAWVMKLAERMRIDFQRSHPQVECPLEGDQALEGEGDPMTVLEHKEVVQVVQAAIERLSPADQDILARRALSDPCAVRDIAQNLEISDSAARQRLSRARRRLRDTLQQDPQARAVLGEFTAR